MRRSKRKMQAASAAKVDMSALPSVFSGNQASSSLEWVKKEQAAAATQSKSNFAKFRQRVGGLVANVPTPTGRQALIGTGVAAAAGLAYYGLRWYNAEKIQERDAARSLKLQGDDYEPTDVNKFCESLRDKVLLTILLKHVVPHLRTNKLSKLTSHFTKCKDFDDVRNDLVGTLKKFAKDPMKEALALRRNMLPVVTEIWNDDLKYADEINQITGGFDAVFTSKTEATGYVKQYKECFKNMGEDAIEEVKERLDNMAKAYARGSSDETTHLKATLIDNMKSVLNKLFEVLVEGRSVKIELQVDAKNKICVKLG